MVLLEVPSKARFLSINFLRILCVSLSHDMCHDMHLSLQRFCQQWVRNDPGEKKTEDHFSEKIETNYKNNVYLEKKTSLHRILHKANFIGLLFYGIHIEP